MIPENNNEENQAVSSKPTPIAGASCPPKIIQLLLAPNDSNWQGMLLGLADNGDTYRLDHADGWVIWFDGISTENAK